MARPAHALRAAVVIAVAAVAFWHARIIAPPWKVPFAATLGNLDFFSQIFPMSALGADWIRHGVLPLWNPYQMAGHPFLASALYGVFYPLNAPYLFLPTEVAIEVVVALHLVLAGWFTWLYAAEVGLAPVARYAGAAVYVGCGFMTSQAGWFTPAVASSTWVPLALFAVERLVSRADGRSAMLLAAALALTLLGGWVHFWLYTMYAVALYAACRLVALTRRVETRGRVPRVVGLLMLAVALGAAVTAVQVLPSRELQALGPRRPGGLSPAQLLAFPSLNPRTFAEQVVDWRLTKPFISPFYLGGVAAAAIAWSTISPRGASRVVAVWVLFVASFLTCIAAWTPFYEQVYLRLPGARWFRIPERAAFPFAFAAALLVAYGTDAVATVTRDLPRRAAALLSAGVLGAAGWVLAARQPWPLESFMVLALAVGAFVAAALARSPRTRVLLAALLVVLAIGELVRGTTNVFRHPYHEIEALHRQDFILEYIREHQGLDRTYLDDPGGFHYSVTAKQGSLARIYSISDYEPLSLLRFDELYALLRGKLRGASPFVGDLSLDAQGPHRPLLDLLSVRFVVTARSSAVARWLASSSDAWQRVSFPLAGAYELYEATRPLPRAYVATHVERAPDDAAGLAALAASGFDPRATAIIEEDAGRPPAPPAASAAPTAIVPARITRYEPRAVVVEADAPAASYLVLTDTYYPGWLATVDGVATAIYPANHVLRGVPLAAGHHEIVFRYEPATFTAGAWISALTLLAMTAIAATNRPRSS